MAWLWQNIYCFTVTDITSGTQHTHHTGIQGKQYLILGVAAEGACPIGCCTNIPAGVLTAACCAPVVLLDSDMARPT